ncbi:MAG: ferritin family protein [Desulfobulbaceae bacterium]|nr:ferritin family protein [Desulfobulbaceae bacterium]
MAGGIRAWEGQTATGAPEAGMAYFSKAVSLEHMIALAWGLEDGSRLFYTGVATQLDGSQPEADLFTTLATAEVQHKQHLLDSYKAIVGTELNFDDLPQDLAETAEGKTMEGGIPVAAALAWAKDHNVEEILDFSMALEVNAYDLYIKMGRKVEDGKAKQIFKKLADEEQLHLRRLGKLLDSRA